MIIVVVEGVVHMVHVARPVVDEAHRGHRLDEFGGLALVVGKPGSPIEKAVFGVVVEMYEG